MPPADPAPRDRMEYCAEITGHQTPFKWELFRRGGNILTWTKIQAGRSSGEAETFEEACFDAQYAATQQHDGWIHRKTVKKVDLGNYPLEPETAEAGLPAYTPLPEGG